MPSLKLRRIGTMTMEAFRTVNHENPVYFYALINIKEINILTYTKI